MSTAAHVTVEIDHRSAQALGPAEIPVCGTLAFVPGGNLLVFERSFERRCAVVHEYAPAGDGWAELRAVTIKGLRGSPVGCAASPDGTRVAAGLKTARVYGWPGGGVVASMPAVKYQLERHSLGFSPDGALLAVGDGGYVSPRQRAVQVCDAATGDRRAAIKTAEWDFVRVAMPDAATVVTLGLALDWEYGDASTERQRVLGCYDVATARARWRRVLRDGQFAGVDREAGLVWVADDPAPYLAASLLGLALDDGHVVREVAFGGDWHAGGAAPAALGPTTLALEVASPQLRLGRTVVLDVEAGRQVALLGRPGGGDAGRCPLVAHAGTRRVAAAGEGKTFAWQLP